LKNDFKPANNTIIMTTLVEKDSSGPAALLLTVLIIFLIAGGIWFAYANGVLGGKPTLIENNKNVIMPAQPSIPTPANAPESPKPEQQPAR
jgi:hypothetical protein